ncbi:dTDP-4-dehydrorhamnose 3,5-epimerase [Xenophilus aerolatus]|nr:dTDP-4-dehydrorhamnose 3,5-epimerase [Xenophilus aerolatus]
MSGTLLQGLAAVRRTRIEDERGFFSRFFCAAELSEVGFDEPIAQINHTLTRRTGSVRGLHFQYPPYAEVKLVSCVRGKVWDVAVDIRRGSPTFMSWHAELLTAENACSLLIPKGFAHGFQALTPDAELIYLHSAPYAAGAEGALNPRDPRLAIDWPLPFADLSERDARHPMVDEGFLGIEL